jgi:hypothetical protein
MPYNEFPKGLVPTFPFLPPISAFMHMMLKVNFQNYTCVLLLCFPLFSEIFSKNGRATQCCEGILDSEENDINNIAMLKC